MFPQHSGPGVAHDDPDLFAPFPLITMDRTFGAGRFFGTELAAFQPRVGIVKKLLAFSTQTGCMMMIAAVDLSHHVHGFPFPGQPLFREIIFRLSAWFKIGGQLYRFSERFHALIVTQAGSPDLDLSQSYLIWISAI